MVIVILDAIAFFSALTSPATVSLFNTLGQKIKEYGLNELSDQELKVDFNSFGVESGMCPIQVISGSSKSNYKVIYQP